MLKAYIVDDEPLARGELSYLLRRNRKVEVVGEAESVPSAIRQIEELRPDIVFVDIQLGEDSGLELAQRLLDLNLQADIVFATAYDEFALKAFELDAVDYILKPYDERRILQTVERAIKRRELQESGKSDPDLRPADRNDKLAVTVDERIIIIPTSDILYLSSAEGKTVISAGGRLYQANEPLTVFEQKLRNTPIVRVHRAYLANLDGIVEIQPWFHSTCNLIMKDGSKVPVSRTYMKELKQRIGF